MKIDPKMYTNTHVTLSGVTMNATLVLERKEIALAAALLKALEQKTLPKEAEDKGYNALKGLFNVKNVPHNFRERRGLYRALTARSKKLYFIVEHKCFPKRQVRVPSKGKSGTIVGYTQEMNVQVQPDRESAERIFTFIPGHDKVVFIT